MNRILVLIAMCVPVVGVANTGISRVVPSGTDNATGRVVRSDTNMVDRTATTDGRVNVTDANVANRSGAMVRNRAATEPKIVQTQDSLSVQRAAIRDLAARAPMTMSLRATKPRVAVPVNSDGNLVSRTTVSGVANVRTRAVTPFSVKKTESVVARDMGELMAEMENEQQIESYCKAQFATCMDNFCNVLSEEQGRCSCSKNLKNYAKTEEALKQITESLQDVAQQIQYIGLTRDEVYTLFSQTVAEEEMQGKSDNSQIKTQLDKIYDMVVDVKPGTATTTDSTVRLDLGNLLDFTIDSTSFDFLSMFNTQESSASISNQRGEQLYKTAAARCKASVIDVCRSQGVETSVITNAYDLEIDKACIAYEAFLTQSNDEMRQTVRNAKNVLQRARLLVRQQKNAYDLRGCVTALDACMQDEFVCGADYENCLDPSGKYIVNGAVVVGSTPGQSVDGSLQAGYHYDTDNLYATWNYGNGKNAWSSGSVIDYITQTVTGTPQVATAVDMSKFLQYKIGYYDNETDRNYGMCMSVLNKCQDVTYNKDGEYLPNNNVVKEYLQRTFAQIKMRQDSILASYAEDCIPDVKSCLSQNGFVEGAASGVNNIPINACRQQIITCMSVNGDANAAPDPSTMQRWVTALYPTK